MFENSGQKLRSIAVVTFAIAVICAVISWVVMTISGGVVSFIIGLFTTGLTVFAAWVGTLNIVAIADAARYAEDAAYLSGEALTLLRKMNGIKGGMQSDMLERPAIYAKPAEKPKETVIPPSQKYNPNHIPAWKRVQMEQENKQ